MVSNFGSVAANHSTDDVGGRHEPECSTVGAVLGIVAKYIDRSVHRSAMNPLDEMVLAVARIAQDHHIALSQLSPSSQYQQSIARRIAGQHRVAMDFDSTERRQYPNRSYADHRYERRSSKIHVTKASRPVFIAQQRD